MSGPPDAFAALGAEVAQVGVVVPDLDRALAAHAALGPWSVWTYDCSVVPDLWCTGDADFAFRIALNAHTPQLELIQPLRGDGPHAQALADGQEALHHLGFLCADVAATSAAMEAAGIPVVMRGSGHGADGTGAFAYYDTRPLLGYMTEAIERPRRRREPELVVGGTDTEEER